MVHVEPAGLNKQEEPKSQILDDMINLAIERTPPGSRERRELKKEINREIQEAQDELDFLNTGRTRTAGDHMTSLVVDRLKAVNPVRDLNRVGASRINGGLNPWRLEDDDSALIISLGTASGIAATIAAAVFTHNPLIAAGAGVLGAAPMFIVSWTARTLFNLAAGIITAVAAPAMLAAARIHDLKHPGQVAARDFRRTIKGENGGLQFISRIRAREKELEGILCEKKEVIERLESENDYSEAELRDRWLKKE